MRATTNKVSLDYVETPSGRFVNMREPDPADITLEDVAHKLAQTNRYGGSSKHPYNVAQHAVFVSERLKRQGWGTRLQLLGLHHDDPEAFLMDIPKPWKAMLGPIYKEMTIMFEAAIEVALDLPRAVAGVSAEEHKIIKAADSFALLVEARNLMPSGGRRWNYLESEFDLPSRIVTPNYYKGEQYWADSKSDYLALHEELTNG